MGMVVYGENTEVTEVADELKESNEKESN